MNESRVKTMRAINYTGDHTPRPHDQHGIFMHPDDGDGIPLIDVMQIMHETIHMIDMQLDSNPPPTEEKKRELQVRRSKILQMMRQVGTLYRAGVTELDWQPGTSINQVIQHGLTEDLDNNNFAMSHREHNLDAPE